MTHLYLIALGSNMRHHRHGRPRDVLVSALEQLEKLGIEIMQVSQTITSEPVGPSIRRFANAAALIRTEHSPVALLERLKTIERTFGRMSGGQRWRARVLDLDIILWSGGSFASRELTIPHPLFREREFVLRPAVEIAPHWRDPVSGLALRHIRARLTRKGRLTR